MMIKIMLGLVAVLCSAGVIAGGGNATGVGYQCNARDALDDAVDNARSQCTQEVGNKGYKEFVYEGQRVLLGGDVQVIQGPYHYPTYSCNNGNGAGHGGGLSSIGRVHLTYATAYCEEL